MATSDVDALTDLLGSATIASTRKKQPITITRTLLGSYNWRNHGEIFIPGFPPALKSGYLRIRVGKLDDSPAPPEMGHANEYLHSVYFEPVQEVLASVGQELNKFDILTDRNNLRKVDDALQEGTDYVNFVMYLQKIDGTLVIKREGMNESCSMVGVSFEEALCEESPFESCHAIVSMAVSVGKESPVKLLVRGEIDACAPTTKGPKIGGYELSKTTDTGLKVYKCNSSRSLQMADLREIKMARNLKDSHHFQSWILGVPSIVHGAGMRSCSDTEARPDFKERLVDVVDTLLALSSQMEENRIYKLWRVNGGKLEFGESRHDRAWLNLSAAQSL